jgi:hypothetical protein
VAISADHDTTLSLAGAVSSEPYAGNLRQVLLIMLLALVWGIIVSSCRLTVLRSLSKPTQTAGPVDEAWKTGNLQAQVADSRITEINQLDIVQRHGAADTT